MSVTRVAWLVLVASLAMQEPWRLGIIGSAPRSPDSDAFAFVRGAELGVAEAAARGRKVELVVADDGGQVEGAKVAVAKLKSQNVLGLIGPLDASLVAPCRECLGSRAPFSTASNSSNAMMSASPLSPVVSTP